MNVGELIERIENHEEYDGGNYGDFINEFMPWTPGKYEYVDGLGELTTVEIEGGGEGDGDYTHIVFKVDGTMFKIEGYHVSHDGTYYDGRPYLVKPKLVERTEYVKA